MRLRFEIIGTIRGTETIAENRSIRDVHRLRRKYGSGHWRKLKGTALVRLEGDIIRQAELHWYEAHGIGRKEIRIKRLLD